MMKLKPQNYITLIVLILFIISCSTKTKKQVISNVKKINTISKDSLDKAVNEMMKKYKVPGVSVGIIISGKLDTTFCYGLSQEQTENEVNSNTIFSVGSISKVVNALLILRLVEVGKLDLDTDVNEYLKDWKVEMNEFTKESPVTLRHILSHTAGFSVHGFGNYYPNEKLPNTLQILNGDKPAKNDKIELIHPVGTEYDYSGGGITVSQKIIEDITGMSYEKAAQELLLNPLNLKRTSFENPLPQSLGNIAKAHNQDGKLTSLPRGYQAMPEKAAAGLWTTPSDLSKLLGLIVFDNIYISADSREDMTTRAKNSEFGLGPYVDNLDGKKVVVHNGVNDSYGAKFNLYWDEKTGYIIFANGTNGYEMIRELRVPFETYSGVFVNYNKVKEK